MNPEFLRHRDVVAAEYDRLADALEWPPEQPQVRTPRRPPAELVFGPGELDELCGATQAEQPQGDGDVPESDVCVCGDPNCMPYWRPVHEHMNAMRLQHDRNVADFTKAMIEEICELRTELEKRAAERDGDVRAVAALAAADNDDELDRAVSDLIARFADRIAELEARDAKTGEQR